ncbi:MAG: homoserine O-succinyltransferase [Ruminococcaceae bacterium]|nr:homoserine O-succinyltransferase [Oscillospiraceae bacterium]
MPIKVPADLPAVSILENENIFVMDEIRAVHQDIRPLKIAVLNLMPTKIVTETQLIRLLSNTSLQVELTLLYPSTAHKPKHTPEEHMDHFYTTFDDVRNEKFDGLIITGAPVENLDFSEVGYWNELCEIMEWSKDHVYSTLHICWAAQAALYYHYGIPKHSMPQKMFGIFPHTLNVPEHPLLRGFSEVFNAPHSRHTDIDSDMVRENKNLEVLAESDMAGIFLIGDKSMRRFFATGHLEYDFDTLSKEYFRDVNKGLEIDVPYNYFPDNDPTKKPLNTWKSHAHLLFANWLNYCVYQMTPFDINEIK